jgi:lysophospholipid acyltransferase (LPLAT)-like uncharacterized protein
MKKDRSNILTELKWKLVGILGKWLVDILFMGSKIEYVGKEIERPLVQSRKLIFAFWHSRLLLVSYMYKGLGAYTLVSRSDDGEIIARILERQGQTCVRGSTKRGGLRALAQHIKLLKTTGNPGAIIPDGPRGPRFKAQPGVITLAQKTGFPILPVTYSARHAKTFNSWDRFMLPRPFSRCRVIFGNPIHVEADLDKSGLENCRRLLEDELCRITTEADEYFSHPPTLKEN